jgi:SAM-dependent methyltransferase
VADLACGAAGTALLAAAAGRQVTAVDISELALGLLGAGARRRGREHLVTLVHADLARWRPPPGSHALVLCTGWWERAVFGVAAAAVAPAACSAGKRSRPRRGGRGRACRRTGAWDQMSPRPCSRRASPRRTSMTCQATMG